MEKKNGFWKFLKVILAIGAICLAAVKIYEKFFKKAEDADADTDDAPVADEEESAPASGVEVSAKSVIADAELMEEPADETPAGEDAPAETEA